MRLIYTLLLLMLSGIAFGQVPSGAPNYNAVNGVIKFPGNSVKCDGTTDDTAAMNAALATMANGGGSAEIAPDKLCLIDSANLVIPANVILRGNSGPGQQAGATAAILSTGSGLILNAPNEVQLTTGSQLRSIIVRRKGLIAVPAASDVIAQVQTWAAENSNGVHVLSSAGGGAVVDDVMVIGFNTCFFAESGRYTLNNIAGDCASGVEAPKAGDISVISNARMEPYYRSTAGFNSGDSMRPGAAFNLGGGGTSFNNSFSLYYATGLLLADGATSIQATNLTFEFHDSGGNGVTNNACVRASGTITAIWLVNVSCNAYDQSFVNEAAGPMVLVTPNVQGNAGTLPVGYYLGAVPAANPPTMVWSGTFTPGDTISATFTGATIQNSPVTVSYKVKTGDTATIAANQLRKRINLAWQLSSVHLHATGATSTITIQYPTSLTVAITCGGTGGEVCTTGGTGTAHSGSNTIIVQPFMPISGAPIQAGLDSTNSIVWANIVAPAVGAGPLSANWLQVGSASLGQVRVTANNYKTLANGNLTGCGTAPNVTAGSTDQLGIANEGNGATGCTITFAVPFWQPPSCSVQLLSGTGSLVDLTVTTTQLILNNVAKSSFRWNCEPNGAQMSGTYTFPPPPSGSGGSSSVQSTALNGTCCGGATTETVIGTIRIPAGAMGSLGSTELDCLASWPNNANSKSLRFRLTNSPTGSISGGQLNSDIVATTTSQAAFRLMVRNTSPTTQEAFSTTPVTPYGANVGSPNTFALDTTTDGYISVNGITAVGSDTITLDHCRALIAKGP